MSDTKRCLNKKRTLFTLKGTLVLERGPISHKSEKPNEPFKRLNSIYFCMKPWTSCFTPKILDQLVFTKNGVKDPRCKNQIKYFTPTRTAGQNPKIHCTNLRREAAQYYRSPPARAAGSLFSTEDVSRSVGFLSRQSSREPEKYCRETGWHWQIGLGPRHDKPPPPQGRIPCRFTIDRNRRHNSSTHPFWWRADVRFFRSLRLFVCISVCLFLFVLFFFFVYVQF